MLCPFYLRRHGSDKVLVSPPPSGNSTKITLLHVLLAGGCNVNLYGEWRWKQICFLYPERWYWGSNFRDLMASSGNNIISGWVCSGTISIANCTPDLHKPTHEQHRVEARYSPSWVSIPGPSITPEPLLPPNNNRNGGRAFLPHRGREREVWLL